MSDPNLAHKLCHVCPAIRCTCRHIIPAAIYKMCTKSAKYRYSVHEPRPHARRQHTPGTRLTQTQLFSRPIYYLLAIFYHSTRELLLSARAEKRTRLLMHGARNHLIELSHKSARGDVVCAPNVTLHSRTGADFAGSHNVRATHATLTKCAAHARGRL